MSRILLALAFVSVLLVGETTIALDAVVELGFLGSTKLEAEPDPRQLPPDTQGAVGPEHVVELLNGRYAVYDKRTGVEVAARTFLEFWNDAGVVPADDRAFDPRVVYDPGAGRWFAASGESLLPGITGDFLLAVSRTADPRDGWQAVRVDHDPTDQSYVDFPTIGLDAQAIYLGGTRLHVSSNALLGTVIVVVPKTDLLGATPRSSGATVFTTTNLETGFEPHPTMAPDRNGPPMTYLSGNVSILGVFQAARVEGTATSPTLVPNLVVAVPAFPAPPDAPQPGPKQDLETGGSGNIGLIGANVVAQNGSLWATKGISFDGRAAIQWVEIDEASMTLVQSGVIADAELHFYYPSIAVNTLGEVVIGFSGSSESQFVSAYAVVGETLAGTTTFGAPILLTAGVADYEFLDTKGQNRWGDYSATALDPEDPRVFWTFQAFVAAEDVWGIQIAKLRVVEELPVCGNRVDDDGDGLVDYGEDPGCFHPLAPSEDPQCQDGRDGDADGLIDFDGGASLDLDMDGLVDAQFNPATPPVTAPDPQCAGLAWRDREAPLALGCGLGFELALAVPLVALLRRTRRRT